MTYPSIENDSIASSDVTVISYLPFASEETPVIFPSCMVETDAPGRGPAESSMIPLIFLCAKYEIFKTIVNEVCLGRYLSSVSSNQNVTSVAMSKNDRMVICLHNPSSEAINSIINLPKSTRINGDIAVHLWEESMKDIVPRVSSITNCNGTSSISIRIPCASLQILTMSVIQ